MFALEQLKADSLIFPLNGASLMRPALCLLLACGIFAPAAQAATKDHAEIMYEQQQAKHLEAWQRYPMLGIPLVAKAPVIDGTVGPEEWRGASGVGYALEIASSLKVQDKVRYYLCYTPTHLYIAFQYDRPPGAKTPARQDVIEILMDPSHEHKKYLNVSAGLAGIVADGVAPGFNDAAWDARWDYKARQTDAGWEGEMAVAFTDFPGLAGAPEPGAIWAFDLVRNERTPTDRLAQWAWRSEWHDVKSLAHIQFLGQPLGIRFEDLGWQPQNARCGGSIAIFNGGTEPVQLNVSSALRLAKTKLSETFLESIDSAMTENLGAAIGSNITEEVDSALSKYDLVEDRDETLTVPPQTAKSLDLWAAEKPGSYAFLGRVAQGKQILAGMAVPFNATVPLDIQLKSYLYSADTLAYEVDLRSVLEKLSPEATLAVSVRDKQDNKEIASSPAVAVKMRNQVGGELRFQPEPSSQLLVKAVVRDGGREWTNEVPFVVPEKAEWFAQPAGKTAFVPPPWIPVAADDAECRTLSVTYDWPKNAVIPVFTVMDRNYLQSPPTLQVKDGNGAPVVPEVTSFRLKETKEEHAIYEYEARLRGIGTLHGTVRIEFDGFAWFDLKLQPDKGAELGGLTLELPMKKEYSRLFQRGRMDVWYEDKYAISPGKEKGDPAKADTGRVPETGVDLPFVFQVWVGNADGGVQWCAERPENWHNENPGQAIQIKPGDKETALEIHFVSKKITLDKELQWSFGLQPTPGRAPLGGKDGHSFFQISSLPPEAPPSEELREKDPAKYQGQLVTYEGTYGGGLARAGIKNIIVFSYWNYDHFGYPGVVDAETDRRMKSFVTAMHKQGLRVLLYAGWGISTNAPEWETYGSELVKLPLKNSGYATYWAQPGSLFSDLYTYRVAEMVKKYDLDGVYIDSTTDQVYSLNYGGERWVNDKGEVKGSYPVRSMREYLKRVYKVLHGEARKDGIVYLHQSGPSNVWVENFADVRCPSEFAQSYDGDFDEKFVEMFMVKNAGTQFGLPIELTNKNFSNTSKKLVSQILAALLPMNAGVKSVNLKAPQDYSLRAEPMPVINRAWTWLGSDKAEYLPWWQNSSYLSTRPASDPANQVLNALWLRKGEKAVVCVSNLAGKPRQIELVLNLKEMGFKDVKVEDALLGESIPVEGNTIKLDVDYERYRLLKIQPK